MATFRIYLVREDQFDRMILLLPLRATTKAPFTPFFKSLSLRLSAWAFDENTPEKYRL